MSPLKYVLPALTALLGLAAAQTNKPDPVKTTVKTCGGYQIKLVENGFGDPQDSITLSKNGKVYATYKDEMVSFGPYEGTTCTDLTGDGIPEVMLMQFSGGAHCCTTGHLWSLTTPPKLLLEQGLGHSGGWGVAQVDGKGPKELLADDWRFAYAYDMSFADSPALLQILGLRNGRYVDVTREYPQYALGTIRSAGKDESVSGAALYNYATYLTAGQPQKAEAYLQKLPKEQKEWLQNYAPDIRQSLTDFGMTDWPERAGAKWNELRWSIRWSIGGSFSRAGTQELLAITVQKQVGQLRLYHQQGTNIVASAPLRTFKEVTNLDEVWPPALYPAFTVRRASGRDDAVIYDRSSGTVSYLPYRVGTSSLTLLGNDPMGVACTLLSDLGNLGTKRASLYGSNVKTDAQRREIRSRIGAAQGKAAGWQKLYDPKASKTGLDLARLGNFDVQSLEVSRESDISALIAGAVSLGHVAPNQSDDYVQSKRQTFAIFLTKQGGAWKVTRWQMNPRLGAGPLGEN